MNKKSCTLALAIYGLPMLVYWIAIEFALGWPMGNLDLIEGAMSGLFVTLGISLIVMSGDARLLGRAAATPLKDGERVAVCGPLVTLGLPLRAPFSGTACIAYNYNIYHTVPGSKGSTITVPHVTGMALTPSAVESPLGRTKILAYPLTEGFASAERKDETWLRNARTYVAATQYTERQNDSMGALNFSAMSAAFSLTKEILTDDDGAMRRDDRFIHDEDIASLHVTESAIPTGENVCLIGQYSAARGGIVPNQSGTTRLIRGTRSSVRRTFFFERIGHMVLGAVFVAVPNIALWFLFTRH